MTVEPVGTCLSSGPLLAGGLPYTQALIPSMQTSDRTVSGQALASHLTTLYLGSDRTSYFTGFARQTLEDQETPALLKSPEQCFSRPHVPY